MGPTEDEAFTGLGKPSGQDPRGWTTEGAEEDEVHQAEPLEGSRSGCFRFLTCINKLVIIHSFTHSFIEQIFSSHN